MAEAVVVEMGEGAGIEDVVCTELVMAEGGTG